MAQTINPKYADIKRREKENLAAITAKYEAAKANMLKDDIARIISDAEYNYRIAKTEVDLTKYDLCLLYTSPSPRDRQKSRMPSSA